MLKTLVRVKEVHSLLRHTVHEMTNIKHCRIISTKEDGFAKAAIEENRTGVKKRNPFATAGPKHSHRLEFSDEENSYQAEVDESDTGDKKINPFVAVGSPLPETNNNSPEPPLSEDEKANRLKVLQLEVDIAYQEGRRVPQLSFFQEQHWDHVLTLQTKSARAKYYAFLWQIACKKESKELKKLETAGSVLERKERIRIEREENTHIFYGLSGTTLFLRVYDTTINYWANHRLIRAMQFSPKIVLDCSYDNYMTKREAINASKQLMLCFADNRAHDDPFDLHYCNVNMNSNTMRSLKRYIPTMLEPDFPLNVHDKCFTEMFPKENIVYLTPHCRTDLERYNPDDVYVIGAMVDTTNTEPLSLAKAKKLGLRMARLPLDRYLQWGSGSGKSLTLNQMIKIMLDLKFTGDWEKSLTHVPRRKIMDLQREQQRERRSWDRTGGKVTVRLDKLLDFNQDTKSYPPREIRSHKDKLQFNLDTWGSNKKKTF